MPTRGIRGATSVEQNRQEDIISETQVLLEKMLEENQVDTDEIASILFTVTEELTAEFPAVAARNLGLKTTPLLCFQEIPVPGSLDHCIRVLIHVNSTKSQLEIKHIYLNKAKKLRPDHVSHQYTE